MNRERAIELLQHHSASKENFVFKDSHTSFLGMLRHFDGELYESNFNEVMMSIQALSNDFSNQKIHHTIISSVWLISYYARTWGVSKESMLQSNNLLSEAQITLLTTWIHCIDSTIAFLLDDCEDIAFDNFMEVQQKGGR